MAVETTSDQDYACFGCGKWKSKEITDVCGNCRMPLSSAASLVGTSIEQYELRSYKTRGFYGATFEVRNRIKKPFALKICPEILYNEYEKDFDSEIAKYRQLGSHSNIAELVDAGKSVVEIEGRKVPVYFVVMEWIDGTPLNEFVNRSGFSVGDMYGVVVDIASGVARFEKENLWHNDLKADNILVKRLTDEELEARRAESKFISKIVDFGSAVFRQSEKHKTLDDVRFLAKHINTMCTVLLDKGTAIPKEDRFFLEELGKVIAQALDEHPSRSLTKAQALLNEVKTLYQRRLLLDEEVSVRLDNPFVYLNANDFPAELYVNMLFEGGFPWLTAITKGDPQSKLIVGPRGCGKTMLLKSLRLKTRVHEYHVGEIESDIRGRLERDGFGAFFVSARIEIGNHCPLEKLPKWATNVEVVNLYFNLLYAYEVVDTLNLASAKKLIHIEAAAERDICDYIVESTGIERALTFGGITSCIQHLQRRILLGEEGICVNSEGSGPAFLSGLASVLKARIEFFRPRHVIFLLDDFSLPRVPSTVQQALLPTVWNSGGGYTFRVTAHSESVAAKDLKGNVYAHGREFSEVNFGSSYVNGLDEEDRFGTIQKCIEDIFQRRFALSESYAGESVKKMLGESSKEPIAREIRRLSSENKLRTLRYHGWGTVVRLCSGDISYVIDILSKILRERPKKYPVGKSIQSREIKTYAKSELYRAQDYPARSCSLYDVALHFGKFSLFKLQQESVGSEKRPAEYLRLEVEIDRLSDRAKEALGELLRSGIFVDGGFSSSSKANPARRLIFRKLYTPVFPTTYVSRDTWSMTARRFEEFINDPKAFVKNVLGEHGVPPEQQSFELDKLINQD